MSKQKIIDYIYNGITYLSSSIGVVILFSIILFVFNTGMGELNFSMLSGNYWAENYLFDGILESSSFNEPNNIEGYYADNWGISLIDGKDGELVITYLDENSPLVNLTINDEVIKLKKGYTIEKIALDDTSVGKILGDDASTTIKLLNESKMVKSIYFKTESGGIYGGIIATFYLIFISLLIVLPIGISSAIYLNEYSKNRQLNNLLQTGIDALVGIPSIVYGLMGVTVLFPITQMFNINTTSILLGGLTMSIILLPTIIKATTEALKNVPDSLRQGSLSLGATNFQTIYKVILPCCINGILTGVLLSVGRVIGESAALIYTMGTFVNDAPTISSGGSSLAVMIYSLMVQENPNFKLASAISIIILVIVMCLNVILRIAARKLERKLG